MKNFLAEVLLTFAVLSKPHTTQAHPRFRKLLIGDQVTIVTLRQRESRFKFVVSIQDGSSEHSCTGSLLNEWWILTAAHCLPFALTKARLMDVVLNISDNKQVAAHKRRNVSLAVSHPNYNVTTLKDDIALLKMDQPVYATGRTVQLPSAPITNIDGTAATLVGWGSLDVDCKVYADELRTGYQMIQTVSDRGNSDSWNLYGKPFTQTSDVVGLGCGDSGGPVLVYGADGLPTQVGVNSWGIGYGSSDGYTRVSIAMGPGLFKG